MDPRFLASLASIGANKKAYKPSDKAIKDMFYKLFRGKNSESETVDILTPVSTPTKPQGQGAAGCSTDL